MKKLVVVLGASGLVGSKITSMFGSKFDMLGTYNLRRPEPGCQPYQLDITDMGATRKFLYDIKPDYIINTTALHNVDYCQDHKTEAFEVNSKSIDNIRRVADMMGARFVHISTDYVFGGTHSTPYTEDDLAHPVNTYGKSKLSGESKLKDSDHYIVRSSVVYGWAPIVHTGSSSGKSVNFAMWLLYMLNGGKCVKLVTDQYATATLADSLAESVMKIVESTTPGLYHVSGLSCESRYEFGRRLAYEFGYDADLITPIDSVHLKQKAQRPLFSCLDCTKAVREFDLRLYSTPDALKIMRRQVGKEAPHLLGKP